MFQNVFEMSASISSISFLFPSDIGSFSQDFMRPSLWLIPSAALVVNN